MISKTQLSYFSLCEHCFKFLSHPSINDVIWLFLSINAPVNFLQLDRYGKYGEQRYRQQFEGDFDSFNFNAALIRQYCGTRRAITFDPSYIPKWGLEIGGISILYLDNHTALHLEAIQTLPLESETLLDFYARIFLNLLSGKKQRKAFSLSDIKTINHNTLLLERFITMFAIKPNVLKNNQNVKELLLYGTIAA